jgi:hypothetical protein
MRTTGKDRAIRSAFIRFGLYVRLREVAQAVA